MIRMFSTGCASSDLGQDHVGGGVFLDLETSFFGDGVFLCDGAKGDDAGRAFRKCGGAFVGAGGKATEAFVGALGNNDLQPECGGLVGTGERGLESTKAGRGGKRRGEGEGLEKDDAAFEERVFGFGVVGVGESAEFDGCKRFVEGGLGFWFWKSDDGHIKLGGGCVEGCQQDEGENGESFHAGRHTGGGRNGNEISLAHGGWRGAAGARMACREPAGCRSLCAWAQRVR